MIGGPKAGRGISHDLSLKASTFSALFPLITQLIRHKDPTDRHSIRLSLHGCAQDSYKFTYCQHRALSITPRFGFGMSNNRASGVLATCRHHRFLLTQHCQALSYDEVVQRQGKTRCLGSSTSHRSTSSARHREQECHTNNTRRQIDTVCAGAKSISVLLKEIPKLEIIQCLTGERVSPELMGRLQSIELGDFVQPGGTVDGLQLLRKLSTDQEWDCLNGHVTRIEDGGQTLETVILKAWQSMAQMVLRDVSVEDSEAIDYYSSTELEDLSSYIVPVSAESVGEGSFGTVFKADLVKKNITRKVALKVLKVYQSQIDDPAKKQRIQRRYRREIRVWRDLHHINVVPLLGLVHGFRTGYSRAPFPSMVCPWMNDGSLTQYLIANREKLTLKDRFKLMTDVIDGLSYLHSESVIHGDLTSANVLISETTACLSDFGLSQIVSEFVGRSYMTYRVGGAVRWRAPELVPEDEDDEEEGDSTKPGPQMTKACDVYSFGGIVHEIISGHLPYYDIPTDHMVLVYKTMHTRPARPPCELLTDEIWDLIQLCWRDEPAWRPEVTQISRKLRTVKSGYSNEELAKTLPPVVEVGGLEWD
ncbi:unnamed protein product [Cyclocybe aegerita]|uniref:Protein kinase domain-containing protein n=1 Tax=Cyclocybe aegerita TaxID=1973307 RepID=A0A8S0W5X3_CYCAE|nr:unnamed protein product [Cyclocybe aegerita]